MWDNTTKIVLKALQTEEWIQKSVLLAAIEGGPAHAQDPWFHVQKEWNILERTIKNRMTASQHETVTKEMEQFFKKQSWKLKILKLRITNTTL